MSRSFGIEILGFIAFWTGQGGGDSENLSVMQWNS